MTDPNRWIAYELHDGLMQWLQSGVMLLGDVQTDEDSQRRFTTAVQSLRHAIDEGRQLINFLESLPTERPPGLGPSIAAAISQIQPMLHESGQDLVVEGSIDNLPCLEASHVWNITRVVQQALNNALQHAGPTTIRMSIDQSADNLVLEVSDGGCGFDPQQADSGKGWGLSSMRQRAKSIQARLEIDSQPSQGTRIRLTIPLRSNST